MPFTLAHPAAVLPLRTGTPALPFTALVVGSMAPDIEYFLPVEPFPRHLTHAFVGVPTVDLVIGLVTLLVAQVVLAAPLAALLPPEWGDRVRAWGRRGVPRTPRALALTLLALALGSLTHVAWDAFTHDTGQVVQRVPALRHLVAGHPVWAWLQILSSVLGLAVIGLVAWRHRWWGFAPLPASQRHDWARGSRLVVPVMVVAGGVVLAAVRLSRSAVDGHSLPWLVLTGAGEGVILVVAVWAAAYWLRRGFATLR